MLCTHFCALLHCETLHCVLLPPTENYLMNRENSYVIKIPGLVFIKFSKNYEIFPLLIRTTLLTLTPLTWRIWWVHKNAIKWQMGFNSALKVLIHYVILRFILQPQSNVLFCVVVTLLLFIRNKKNIKKLGTCICRVFNVIGKTVLKLSVQLNSVKCLRADNSFRLFTYTQVSVNRFHLHLQGSNRSLKLWFTLIADLAVRPTA
jgi:hypothetical protein